MSAKDNSDGVILPHVGYSIEGAAKAIGVTARWFRESLINTGEIPSVRRGYLELVMGHSILHWIEKEMQVWEKSQKGENDEQATKRSSKS